MILFFIIFIASFILTYLVKLMAQKKMLMDVPNERSSHDTPTPRGGGLAIAVAWFLGISFLHFQGQLETKIYYALMSGVLISGISFVDDIYTIKSLPRILVQAISTLIALYFIGGLQEIDFGFFTVQQPILLNALAFFGILWFINLFNFIDGINGYSSSGAVFISMALFFFVREPLLLVLIGAILGFLPWNWGKAKIFMGDIGSTLLGFTIAVLLVHYNNSGQFSIFYGLIITAVFWFDATLTLIKRLMNKERVGQPHKKHAYQRMVQYGFSHQRTTTLALLINLVLFSIVLIGAHYQVVGILALGVVLLLLFIIYQLIGRKKPFKE